MVQASKKNKRYDFNNNNFKHYILIDRELSKNEQETLKQILASFPHFNSNSGWYKKFPLLDFNLYSKELLAIAANAYDGIGNTVLGVACSYGQDVSSVQRLIDIGADVNRPDHNMGKLPLHWGIYNNLSIKDNKSYEAVAVVKCLLNNGARTDIVCYDNSTPLQYAESREFIAAANLIKKHDAGYTRGAIIGLFEETLPSHVSGYLSLFLNKKNVMCVTQVKKSARDNAKKESFIDNDLSTLKI